MSSHKQKCWRYSLLEGHVHLQSQTTQNMQLLMIQCTACLLMGTWLQAPWQRVTSLSYSKKNLRKSTHVCICLRRYVCSSGEGNGQKMINSVPLCVDANIYNRCHLLSLLYGPSYIYYFHLADVRTEDQSSLHDISSEARMTKIPD